MCLFLKYVIVKEPVNRLRGYILVEYIMPEDSCTIRKENHTWDSLFQSMSLADFHECVNGIVTDRVYRRYDEDADTNHVYIFHEGPRS